MVSTTGPSQRGLHSSSLPAELSGRRALRLGLPGVRSSTSFWHHCYPDAGEKDQLEIQEHLFQKTWMWVDATSAVSKISSPRVSQKGGARQKILRNKRKTSLQCWLVEVAEIDSHQPQESVWMVSSLRKPEQICFIFRFQSSVPLCREGS